MRYAMLLATVAPLAFMADVCDTVMVKNEHGDAVRINKSDYDADPDKYKLHADDKKDQPDIQVGEVISQPAPGLVIPPAPSAPHFDNPVAPQTANADTLLVSKEGKKFFVVDATGTHVTGKLDIDEKGYNTDAEAWAAVMRVKRQPFEQSIQPPANMPTAEQIEEAAKNPQA